MHSPWLLCVGCYRSPIMAAFGVTMHANIVNGARAFEHTCPVANLNSRRISGLRASTSSASPFSGQRLVSPPRRCRASRKSSAFKVQAIKDGATLDRPLRVAVVGGGPSGACTADTLARAGIETYLLERKMDNCKVNIPCRFFCLLRRRCDSLQPFPTLTLTLILASYCSLAGAPFLCV